jgi:hypothetical protein
MLTMLLAGVLAADPFLAVGNSTTHDVWSFSPVDGSLIQSGLIPDDGTFERPRCVIDSGHGTLLVADQTRDSVNEYSYEGTFIRQIVNSNQVDNIRSIAVRDGKLYVTNWLGANPDTVQRFNLDGSGQETWASAYNPKGIGLLESTVLVSTDDESDAAIHHYDLSGNDLGEWADEFSWSVQQVTVQPSEVLASAMTDGFIAVFTRDGALQFKYLVDNPVGAYRLQNGNLLYSDLQLGDPMPGIYVLDAQTLASTLVAEGQFWDINLVGDVGTSGVPEPGTVALAAAGLLAIVWRRVRAPMHDGRG